MENPFSSHRRAIWIAKRRGRTHGKQGMPHAQWGERPVPYLEVLHSRYSRKIELLDQKLRIIEGQSLSTRDSDLANRVALRNEIAQLEVQAKQLHKDLQDLQSEKHGSEVENPGGRAARRRHVPVWLYVITLIALAAGEYLVTVPAVELVINDEGIKAYAITASFAALSITFAHILGMTMKLHVDRQDPQPVWQLRGMGLLALALIIVVFQLSDLRSQSIESIPFSFGLPEALFGTILFFFVQISFIACAAVLAYYNHSELEDRLRAVRRDLKKTNKSLASKTRQLALPPAGHMTPEKVIVRIKSLLTAMKIVESEYRHIAAEYRGANLLAQKDALRSVGVGLDEPALLIPEERFAAVMARAERAAEIEATTNHQAVVDMSSRSVRDFTGSGATS